MTTYVPVLIGLVLVMVALISLPIVLVNQREHAFLRRLSTTPVAPRWLLAAQVVVNFVLAVMAMILIVAGAAVFYHVPAPAQLRRLRPVGAAGHSGPVRDRPVHRRRRGERRGRRRLGHAVPVPADLLRRALCPAPVDVADHAPHQRLHAARGGSARHAQLDAGLVPPVQPLLVMAAWAVVFGLAAVKLFRWE